MEVKEPTMEYGRPHNQGMRKGHLPLTHSVHVTVPVSELQLLKDIAQKMGWMCHSDNNAEKISKNKKRMDALNRLKGCISLPADFDYKKEVSAAILEKYENL
jgi:hypothetical protein